jgi:hypothetical protein
MEMFSKAVVSGGTGIYYSADNIWIIGRRQEKEGKEVTGYNFIINVEKSRFVKEKSKIPVQVTWAGGIDKYTGLLDAAIEGGFVVKPTMGWYSKCDPETGEIDDTKLRAKALDGEFWVSILNNPAFKQFLKDKYEVGHAEMIKYEDNIEQ